MFSRLRRRGLPSAAALLGGALITASAATASAQAVVETKFPAERFVLGSDRGGILDVESARTLEPLDYDVGIAHRRRALPGGLVGDDALQLPRGRDAHQPLRPEPLLIRRKHDPMTHDEACLHLCGFWMDYLESRGYFLGAGAAVDPEDEAAMIIGSVTPDGTGRGTGVLFMCASGLDPKGPAVRAWMDDCVAAARRDAAEAVAAAGDLAVACSREFRPGLAQ